MTKDVKAYFEHHAKDYASRHEEFYQDLIRYIRSNLQNDQNIKLLDIGCGNGGFVKSLIVANIRFDFILTDLSYEMVLLAKRNLANRDARLLVADGFKLPIRDHVAFDIIHIDSVLHHLIGRSQRESNSLIVKIIRILASKLSNNGVLIIDEWYFQSYVIPSFASFLIFYGLKFINLLKLDLSFMGEIRPGLEVNFLQPKKLEEILCSYGNAFLLRKSKVNFPSIYRLFFLKEKGRYTYTLKRREY